jgi:hypothetical protein
MATWNACSKSAGISCEPSTRWPWAEAGPTVFAAFDRATDYFGSRAQQTMLDFRVRDLDAAPCLVRPNAAGTRSR